MSTEDKTPALKSASDMLKPHEPKLLDAFAKVFRRKRPPQSMRALAPLAMVFFLEAFGLAYLLDRVTVQAAVRAARGPGKDEDDLLDDSDEMTAIRWAAERQDALDRAYRSFARECHDNSPYNIKLTLGQYLKAGHGPDRATFERQWGERNPIDPTTAPKCFDPRAQLSILDAVSTERDGYLGAFVSDVPLRSEAPPVIECMGQTLDLAGCESLDAAAWRAVSKGWIAYLDHRGAVVGLRLIPRTDGIATRLRAPIVNIVSMYQEDKRGERIESLQKELNDIVASTHRREQQWQDATGASDPEMARELTTQRIEQIKTGLTPIINERREMSADEAEAQRRSFAFGNANISNPNITRETIDRAAESMPDTQGVGRMVWPDPDNAPLPLDCVKTIEAQRRGEFVELSFPSTPQIFEQVRAWLMFYQMNICARTPDATGYCTNAIGLNGEIPPKWSDMKQAKRNSYPGFVLFAPDNSAKVVFCAKEPSIGKVGKRKSREPKL